jgi:hypothetical protein
VVIVTDALFSVTVRPSASRVTVRSLASAAVAVTEIVLASGALTVTAAIAPDGRIAVRTTVAAAIHVVRAGTVSRP